MVYSDKIRKHIINNSFDEIKNNIEQANLIAADSREFTDAVARIKEVVFGFITAYTNCPRNLIAISWLDEAKIAIDNINASVEAYINGNDINNIIFDAESYIMTLLDITVKFNCVRNRQSLRSVADGFDAYIETVEGHSKQFSDNMNKLKEKICSLDCELNETHQGIGQRIDGINQKINDEQARLDGLADKYQVQKQEDQEKFSSLINGFTDQFKTENDSFLEKQEELIRQYTENFDEYQKQVENIVGIVNTNMFSHKYKEVANNARRRSIVWHIIAVFLLMGVVAFAIYAFVITTNQDTSWVKLIAKIVVTTAIVTAAGYAARQASKQEKVERYSRKIEMELVSIDPFITSLDEATRSRVKEDIAYKIFGKENAMELNAKETDQENKELKTLLNKFIQIIRAEI